MVRTLKFFGRKGEKMFLWIFIPSVVLLVIGVCGYWLSMQQLFKPFRRFENENLDIKSLRRELHSFQRETEENIDRVFGKFFIFAPIALIGLIAAIVAVILRVFGYIS